MTWRSGGSRNALVHRLFTLGRSISMRDFSLGFILVGGSSIVKKQQVCLKRSLPGVC